MSTWAAFALTALGVVTGPLVQLILVFAWLAARAPYRQRDEARERFETKAAQDSGLDIVVRARYLPEYVGPKGEFGTHLVMVRDCVFTNTSTTNTASVQLRLSVTRANGSAFFYFDDPAIAAPDGFLRNPLSIPPQQSVRGHFVLLLNPLLVPLVTYVEDFGKEFEKSMQRDDVFLVVTNLLSGKETPVKIPANA